MSTSYFCNAVRCIVVGLVVMALAPGALGYVQGISGNVGPTLAYLGDPDFMWNMSGSPLNDGTIGFSTGGTPWSIAPSWSGGPGALDWSALLAVDQSTGGLAKATFQSGGTFALSGKVYQSNQAGSPLLYEGLLFQGQMDAFGIAESSTNMNRVNLFTPPGSPVENMVLIVPTGGWLYTEGRLAPFYLFSFMGVDCRQNGADLMDFQSDIVTYAAMQFTMLGVPEPATVLIFGTACMLVLGRRSR